MFIRAIAATFVTLSIAPPGLAKPFAEMFPEYANAFSQEALDLVAPLDFQQGVISIGNDLAQVTVPEGYYFLAPESANHVLTTIWGNPPGDGILGMIFPADITPLHDDGWGLSLHFEDIGYVSDEDAEGYDYNALLTQMRRDMVDANEWRVDNGYPSVHMVGWAEPPRYDKSRRALYWAEELRFDDSDENTLNFNIRLLGRRGVLVQSFIAQISELPRVKADLPEVLAMTTFAEGNRYADFSPGLDTVAAVGIGGLIAGKAAAKTGLLVVALLFLKKAWFLLLLPLFWLKNLFTRRRGENE